ncbi:MAG: SulP family inorganic anion transporter [Cellulosilyticaceae bacterium]
MLPKLVEMIRKREITMSRLGKDIVAGIIVAIIALPLSIALGISSGVSPEKGLITAIVAGFLISLLGGSKVQIGGPTGAFVVLVYTIVQTHGIDGLIIATIMAGIFLIIMGICKFGTLIKFVPHTITVGFTSGIAVTLLSTQIKDLFGLKIDDVPAEFIPKWQSYFTHINSLDIITVLIGIGCILILVFWPKVSKKIPGSIIALIASTLVVQLFHLPVETIGSRFTQISSSIPMPSLPNVDFSMIQALIGPALSIAVLAAVESLLSAVVADGMIDDKHNSNMELIAQGIANIGSGLLGGIPATGAIARTAANVKNGGRSPISGMVHAIVLLIIMVVAMPLAKMIPMTTLAAILVIVSYNMSEWRTFKDLLKAPKSDVIVLLATFSLTVVFDLIVAISFGMLAAMCLFIKKVADTTQIRDLAKEQVFNAEVTELLEEVDDKVMVYQVNGPMFFGMVQNFMDVMDAINPDAEVMILDLRHAHTMDATAIDALEKVHTRCGQYHITLVLTHIQERPYRALEKIGLLKKIGHKNIYKSKTEAIRNIHKQIKNIQIA